jgi:hypothetical protein
MKDVPEIAEKILEMKKYIDKIEARRQEELKKSIEKRDVRLMMFLNRESNVYEFALCQLEWVLSE